MNQHSSGCYIIDRDYNVVSVNETGRTLYPQLKVGKKCYKCLMGLDSPCPPCPVAAGRKGPAAYVDPIRNISEIVDAVEMEIEGHGTCHALVFSTVENDAAFAATLPTTAQGLKDLALIKALTVDYYDVFSVNLSDDNMTLYRHNGKALDADSVYKAITSYSEGTEDYIARHVIPEDQEMMREQSRVEYLREALTDSEFVVVHYRVLWKDEVHYFYRKVVRIGDADSFDHIVVGVGCEDDVVRERERQVALQNDLRQMEYSIQTGLLTKEAFFVHSGKLMEQYPETNFDFCILRVENLNAVYHQYGRVTGDKILRQIGKTIKEYESEQFLIAYFGDGIFACLIPTAPSEAYRMIMDDFRVKVLSHSKIKNLAFKWSVHRDVRRDISFAELFDKTYYALSTIRANLHQDYVEFDQEMIDRLEWDKQVREGFAAALENGEFKAWYQPKYAVRSREIVGAEALVRWVRPNGEMVPPNRFIPILERSGLINQLDQEIFRQVCVLQKYIKEQGLRQVPISVNLSRASMFTNDISNIYSGIAADYDVNPRNVPIEITESAAVRGEKISDFAESLIKSGFVLYMDDFGAGYSSLASLQIIPFDCIKLDKSLVDFIGKSSGESLLRHTIAFAKESGMSVTAEGVENAEQYWFLKAAGCDEIQGYYFSRPLDVLTFLNTLK